MVISIHSTTSKRDIKCTKLCKHMIQVVIFEHNYITHFCKPTYEWYLHSSFTYYHIKYLQDTVFCNKNNYEGYKIKTNPTISYILKFQALVTGIHSIYSCTEST